MRHVALLGGLLASSGLAHAANPSPSSPATATAAMHATVQVSHGWARPTNPGRQVGGAYLTLNSPVAAVLLAASSPAAGRVELHEMTMAQGVMRMREIERLPLPAGQSVVLQPGGLHLMLFDLKQPLRAGMVIPLQLEVELGGQRHTVQTTLSVQDSRPGPRTASPAPAGPHSGGH